MSQKWNGHMPWSSWVFNQRQFDVAAGESAAILAEAGKDVRRNVPSLKQSECKLFVQRGIRSYSSQYLK